jgi:hypothetical protein
MLAHPVGRFANSRVRRAISVVRSRTFLSDISDDSTAKQADQTSEAVELDEEPEASRFDNTVKMRREDNRSKESEESRLAYNGSGCQSASLSS